MDQPVRERRPNPWLIAALVLLAVGIFVATVLSRAL